MLTFIICLLRKMQPEDGQTSVTRVVSHGALNIAWHTLMHRDPACHISARQDLEPAQRSCMNENTQ